MRIPASRQLISPYPNFRHDDSESWNQRTVLEQLGQHLQRKEEVQQKESDQEESVEKGNCQEGDKEKDGQKEGNQKEEVRLSRLTRSVQLCADLAVAIWSAFYLTAVCDRSEAGPSVRRLRAIGTGSPQTTTARTAFAKTDSSATANRLSCRTDRILVTILVSDSFQLGDCLYQYCLGIDV